MGQCWTGRYRSCSHSTHFTGILKMHLHIFIPLLLSVSVSSLYLLDPKTGRPVARNNRPYWPWRQAEVLQQRSVEPANDVVAADRKVVPPQGRRSDYISKTGTPLYKLRQRNPYGG